VLILGRWRSDRRPERARIGSAHVSLSDAQKRGGIPGGIFPISTRGAPTIHFVKPWDFCIIGFVEILYNTCFRGVIVELKESVQRFKIMASKEPNNLKKTIFNRVKNFKIRIFCM
jgi:hypothetical protein